MRDIQAITWLVKSGDERCFCDRVVSEKGAMKDVLATDFRKGGGNTLPTTCLRREDMEEFFFSYRPSSSYLPLPLQVDRKTVSEYWMKDIQ
jgi:hypothetical protein